MEAEHDGQCYFLLAKKVLIRLRKVTSSVGGSVKAHSNGPDVGSNPAASVLSCRAFEKYVVLCRNAAKLTCCWCHAERSRSTWFSVKFCVFEIDALV